MVNLITRFDSFDCLSVFSHPRPPPHRWNCKMKKKRKQTSFIRLNSSSYTSFFALMSVKYICSMFKIQLRKLFLFVRFCLLVSFGSFFYLVPFLTCKECITAGKWGEQINVKVNIFKHIKGMEKCLYTLLKSWHHWRNIWNKQKYYYYRQSLFITAVMQSIVLTL